MDVEITSVASFLTIIETAALEFRTTPWWRGHQNAAWALTPSVFRNGGTFLRERNLALRFCAKAGARHSQCPAEADMAGWLALMQHHGLPTRLLDWTQQPLTALFFAVERPTTEDGAVWVLEPHTLNATQGLPGLPHAKSPLVAPIIDAAFDEEVSAPQMVVAVASWQVDLRMLLQGAELTVHGTTGDMAKMPQASEFLRSYKIPAKHKTNILIELEYLGIRRSSLFPDLGSLAQDLTSMRFPEWK